MLKDKNKDSAISYSKSTQLISDVHHFGINIHSREMFLNGHTSDSCDNDPGVDHRSASHVLRNLKILEYLSDEAITIHMLITGGSWTEGMGIFDAICTSKCQITIIAYAHATSMSGVILQSADKRIMMPNTHFMLHYGNIALDSTALSAVEAVQFDVKERDKMLSIFVDRAMQGKFCKDKGWDKKQTLDYIDGMMRKKGDWYLTAEEAVEMGFADSIFESRK